MTGDWRMQVQNPPFIHLLTGPLLLVLPERPDPRNLSSWADPFHLVMTARGILDAFNRPLDMLIFPQRVIVMHLTLLLGASLCRWATDLYGWAGGLLALGFYTFSPNILAHGRLVTADLPFAFCFLMAVYTFQKFLTRPSLRRVGIAGMALGLALGAKLSALVLLLLFGLFVLLKWVLLHGSSEMSQTKPLYYDLFRLGLIGVIALLVLWALYGFEMRPWFDGWPPLPLASYARALLKLREHSGEGHQTFLMGQTSMQGWLLYFPVVVLLKTPLPILVGALAGAVTLVWPGFGIGVCDSVCNPASDLKLFSTCISRCPRHWWTAAVIVLPPLLFLGVAMASPLNLGYRHILPIVPFFILLATSLVMILLRQGVGRALGGGLILWLVIGTLVVYPDYLAYFNELAGGPSGGHRYLTDSNLDWGQDLKRLAHYLKANAEILRQAQDDRGDGVHPAEVLRQAQDDRGDGVHPAEILRQAQDDRTDEVHPGEILRQAQDDKGDGVHPAEILRQAQDDRTDEVHPGEILRQAQDDKGDGVHPVEILRQAQDDRGDEVHPAEVLRQAQDDKDGYPIEVALSYFGNVDPREYDISYMPLPSYFHLAESPDFHPFAPASGVYALSVTNLSGQYLRPGVLDWFTRQTPVASIGHTINVYYVDKRDADQPTWLAQCSVPTTPLDDAAILRGFGREDLRRVDFDCTEAWVYPGAGVDKGVYVLHYALLRAQTQPLPPRLQRDPQPRDAFIRRHLNGSRLFYERKPKHQPPSVKSSQPNAVSSTPLALYARPAGATILSPSLSVKVASAETLPQALGDTRALTVPLELWGPLTFMGALVAPTTMASDSADVETVWRVDTGPITRPLSIMAHALTSEGEVLDVADGFNVGPMTLATGDVVVVRHRLQPMGEFWLRTGAYWLDTMARWPLTESPQADAIFIPLNLDDVGPTMLAD
jgi:hypothetical protein